MISKKEFVEPEMVKYEEPLDQVTLHLNSYSTASDHSLGHGHIHGGRR